MGSRADATPARRLGLTMADDLAEALARSPQLYPIQFDATSSAVRLLRLDEAGYRAASFLDERLLGPDVETCVVDWTDLQAASAPLPLEADFVFHIGHVGSTLLARLLGLADSIFALREPALLRPLAAAPDTAADRLEPLLKLYGRTWRAGQRSLVKATSFVSEIAPRILGAVASARAILMLVTPEVYVAGILGGEATCAELARLTPARLERLGRRLGRAGPSAHSPGEMAALGWACEVCALVDCASLHPGRTRWLDFDRFLMSPRAELAGALEHLRGGADPRDLSAMLSSPDMGRYSKAPEHPFSAGLRGQILRQSRQTNGAEIARGAAWLTAMAEGFPQVARALSISAEIVSA